MITDEERRANNCSKVKAWRKAHPEKVREYQQHHYLAHHEKCKEYQRRYYLAHREEIIKRNTEYAKTHRRFKSFYHDAAHPPKAYIERHFDVVMFPEDEKGWLESDAVIFVTADGSYHVGCFMEKGDGRSFWYSDELDIAGGVVAWAELPKFDGRTTEGRVAFDGRSD